MLFLDNIQKVKEDLYFKNHTNKKEIHEIKTII